MADEPKMLHVLHGHDPLDNEELDYSFGYPGPLYYSTAEHDRLMAERDAEIAQLRAERDRWHADANLMLGFADLAYAAGAAPTSSELIAARDRAVAAIRNDALEDAAKVVEDYLMDRRLQNLKAKLAAAIRAMNGECDGPNLSAAMAGRTRTPIGTGSGTGTHREKRGRGDG